MDCLSNRLFCIQMQRLELRLVTLQIIITVSHFMGNFACYGAWLTFCGSQKELWIAFHLRKGTRVSRRVSKAFIY